MKLEILKKLATSELTLVSWECSLGSWIYGIIGQLFVARMESKAQSLGSIWEAQALHYTESSIASISRTKTYQDFAPQTEYI